MSNQKLRVGIIGIGQWASTTHVPDLRATGRAEIVAAARRDPQRLALAKKELGIPETFIDWREMLEKCALDAVVVSTPHDYHLDPTLAALERGLHVLLEKPLATTIADACAIHEAVRCSDRVVMMGVNRRTDATWQTLQRAVSSGQIGRVRQLNAILSTDLRIFNREIPIARPVLEALAGSEMVKTFTLDIPKPGSWRRDPSQMGGDFFSDIGAHLVDVLLWLGGAPGAEVLAYRPPDSPPGSAILSVLGVLQNGASLTIAFNDDIAMGDEFHFAGDGQITVLGERGRITADIEGFGSGRANNLKIERNGIWQELAVAGQTISPAAAFVASVLDGAPVQATVEDAAQVVAFIQSAYRSATERRPVSIEM